MPPIPLGLKKSLGFDDRLGLATPGLLKAQPGIDLALVYRHTAREVDRAREAVLAIAHKLDQPGFRGTWGAEGAGVRGPEDAVNFVAAGYTRFVFEMSGHLDLRADTMSIEELDAEIVALEDRHFYPPDWHAEYLDIVFNLSDGTALAFSDEALARVAVKFGGALAHAHQTQEAMRTCWSGRGELPDLGVSLAATGATTTPLEHLFLGLELRRRGFGLSSLAPCLGLEPAIDFAGEVALFERNLAVHAAITRYCGPYKLGIEYAAYKATLLPLLHKTCGELLHLNFDGVSWLEALRVVARQDAELFRELLHQTRESFPLARQGHPISTTEDDARFLPQVEDAELEATFLDSPKGRQILYVTAAHILASNDPAGRPLRLRLEEILTQHHDLYTGLLVPQFALGKL